MSETTKFVSEFLQYDKHVNEIFNFENSINKDNVLRNEKDNSAYLPSIFDLKK